MAFSLFGKKPPPEPAKPAARKKTPEASAPPRPAASKPSPGSAPAAQQELESLDFTAPGAIEEQEDDSPGQFVIRESSATLHPVVEEAAILFANDQDEAALTTLEAAAAAGGDSQLQAAAE